MHMRSYQAPTVSLVWDDFCQRYFFTILSPMVRSGFASAPIVVTNRTTASNRVAVESKNGPRGARHSAQIIAPHTCIR